MTFPAGLHFDNHFARLGPAFSSVLPPTPLPDPYLVSANADVAALLDLDPAILATSEFVSIAAGNALPPGAEPVSMLYAGHQFGHLVPQLGDGRAILVGQLRNSRGESWDLQLKGAGQTPYSRMGDGRAVLRSSIREYLGSEAMHHLGIPSTRALAVVGSDQPVFRETVETAAVLVRVAPSHVRFGSFEVFFYRDQAAAIETLAEYVIEHDFTWIGGSRGRPARYQALLGEVTERTARMIAQWQAVGFAHGVMNTDNMSVLGLTFDYGPYGFMETWDPDFICNHSDDSGRYAFSNQPNIGFWNLCCLAQALTPLLPVEQCREALARYEPEYRATLAALYRGKLGLRGERDEDPGLLSGVLQLLRENQVDYPMFFRALCGFGTGPAEKNVAVRNLFQAPEAFDAWSAAYRTRLGHEGVPDDERQAGMRKINPRYILRNWLAQRAIDRAQNRDFSEVDRLLNLLRRPFDDQPGFEEYAGPAPEGVVIPSVSCSS